MALDANRHNKSLNTERNQCRNDFSLARDKNCGTSQSVSPSRILFGHVNKAFNRLVQKSIDVKDTFLEHVSDFFERMGYLVYDHPWKFMIIPTLLCCVFSVGFLNRVPEHNMHLLYSLPVSTTTIAEAEMTRAFPIERINYIFAVSSDSNGLFTKQTFSLLDQFWYKVTHLKVPAILIENAFEPGDTLISDFLLSQTPDQLEYDPEFEPPVRGKLPHAERGSEEFPSGETGYIALGDICERTAFGTCQVINPLDLYSIPDQRGNPLRTTSYPNFINFRSGVAFRLDSILGGITKTKFGSTTVVNNATAMAFRLTVLGDSEIRDKSAAWEEGLISLVQNFDAPGIDFYVRAERSINDELSNSSQLNGTDLLLLLCASAFVASFTVVMNSSLDWYRTKTIPALIGIGTTILAYGGGVGVWHMFGMKHVPPAEATPFMILGICVDDVFVILNAYSLTYIHSHDPRKRIGLSLRDAGISITITTLTNVMAFGVGATSVYYSIYVFCILTASGLFTGYLLCITVFLGALSISAKYEQKHVGQPILEMIPISKHTSFKADEKNPQGSHGDDVSVKVLNTSIFHDETRSTENNELYKFKEHSPNKISSLQSALNNSSHLGRTEIQRSHTAVLETLNSAGCPLAKFPTSNASLEIDYRVPITTFKHRQNNQLSLNNAPLRRSKSQPLPYSINKHQACYQHGNKIRNGTVFMRVDPISEDTTIVARPHRNLDEMIINDDAAEKHGIQSSKECYSTTKTVHEKPPTIASSADYTTNINDSLTPSLLSLLCSDKKEAVQHHHDLEISMHPAPTAVVCLPSHCGDVNVTRDDPHKKEQTYGYFQCPFTIRDGYYVVDELDNFTVVAQRVEERFQRQFEKGGKKRLQEKKLDVFGFLFKCNSKKRVGSFKTKVDDDQSRCCTNKVSTMKEHDARTRTSTAAGATDDTTTILSTTLTTESDTTSPRQLLAVAAAVTSRDQCSAVTDPSSTTHNTVISVHDLPILVRAENNILLPREKIPLEPRGTVGRGSRYLFMNYYAPFLLLPAVKTIVILFFLGLLMAAVYYSLKLETGLELRDVTPYGSYLRDFYNVREKYFTAFGDECIISFPDEGRWWDPKIQKALSVLNDRLQQSPHIVFVLNGFAEFMKTYEPIETTSIYNETQTLEHFTQAFLEWKETPRGKLLSPMFILKNGVLKSWKLYYWMNFIDNTRVSIGWVQEVRAVIQEATDNGTPQGYVYSPLAIHWESDLTILKATLINMIVALLAMALVAGLLLRDAFSGCMVLLMIIVIDLAVVGTMPLLGLKLNMLTMVNLVLSIGFAVDYTAHITHCFTHCKGKTRNHRVLECLVLMGLPITEGMITTYGAVAALSVSRKYIMIVVFKMMTAVLVYAFIHGAVLMPIILSLVGPMIYNNAEIVQIKNSEVVATWIVDGKTGKILYEKKPIVFIDDDNNNTISNFPPLCSDSNSRKGGDDTAI